MVVAEVALSFVLLVGSGLMVRSFIDLQRTDPGFDAHGVLTFLAPLNGVRTPEQAAAELRDLTGRLRAIPGVTAVTSSSSLPLDGSTPLARWGTEDALADPNKFRQANTFFIQPGFFQAMHTRLIDGREFTDADNNPNSKVVIIDRAMAARAFPNQRAVGKRLLARVITNEAEWYEIVGVVAHQRHDTLTAEGREAMFYTDGFVGHGAAVRWAVRAGAAPAQLVPLVRAEIAKVNRSIAVSDILPLSTYVERAQAQTRFALVLIVIFGAISAVLAAVGLYGVLSDAVRQRTAEIGLRMALGAAPAGIFRLVVGQGLRLSAAGIAVGVAAALALTRLIASMLVGVEPHDALTFGCIAAVFLSITALACWIPAQRAASLDPTTALREE